MAGLDAKITDLSPGLEQRARAEYQKAKATLQTRLQEEKHPLIRQDLQILIEEADRQIESIRLEEKYQLPYRNVIRMVYGGLSSLLDEQVEPGRRAAALERLRKYTGLESGYSPITKLAEQHTRSYFNRKELLGPPRAELENDLATAQTVIEGIGQLFEKYRINGYQEPYARLKAQLNEYSDFLRKEMLPRSRIDFRLPPELYAFSLKTFGVDIPPQELAAKAHQSFTEIQGEMKIVAAKLAKERGWANSDYRAVIRELKKEQLTGQTILTHYRSRIKDLEAIIRREKLLTLPAREARMRLGTAAESAQSPAPHMRPPRLVGNTGEQGEFVLPLNVPGAGAYDDFTFAAASWTLTAHEARPGHELQFAAMVERGVSQARAIFAFNSVNVEGWGLYSEWIAYPFMPLEGQLISLQHRLLRSARAFIDPELHMGKMTPEQAKRVLAEDVVVSPAMVKQETDRYMFRMPGQATSYFWGFVQLLALRRDVEKQMEGRFQAQAFHDFVLGEGLLPPSLLRKAVMQEFTKP